MGAWLTKEIGGEKREMYCVYEDVEGLPTSEMVF
jgi:hypothetical protein